MNQIVMTKTKKRLTVNQPFKQEKIIINMFI